MVYHVIWVRCSNDYLLFFKEGKYTNSLIDKMCDHKFELEYEDQIITGFLGMYVFKAGTGNEKTFKFVMAHRINRLLELTGICKYAPPRILRT